MILVVDNKQNYKYIPVYALRTYWKSIFLDTTIVSKIIEK